MKKHPLSTDAEHEVLWHVSQKRYAPPKDAAAVSAGTGTPPPWLDTYANKTVAFRFMGQEMVFHLSHALFSSFDIDEGTRLLLKSLAQRIDLGKVRSVLDVGCGVGVIGISIQRAAPGARVVMQDRDALAAAFARENSRANGAAGATVDCALAFWHMAGTSWDLVTSNIPAKAGKPVLTSFFRDAAAILAPGGTAAIVIVATLGDFALSTVRALGCDIVHCEKTKNYLVLHFRAGARSEEKDAPQESLLPYVRARQTFGHGSVAWDLETAWSLPDFDTLGFSLLASLDLIAKVQIQGELLVWNPGQGHLPAYLLKAPGSAVASVRLAGRDCLELAITERNLTALGRKPAKVWPVPTEAGLADLLPEGSIDFLYAAIRPIPRVPLHREMAEEAARILKPGGSLVLASTSTEVHRIVSQLVRFRLLGSRKYMGFRAVFLGRL